MLKIFSRISTGKGRQTWLRLFLAGFLIRALIPIGFMPAPLSSGGPIMICHGGLAGAFFQALTENSRGNAVHGHLADYSAMTHNAHSDHPSDTDDPEPEHNAWDHCPTGATAGTAPLAQNFSFTLLALSDTQTNPEPRFGIPLPPTSSYQARAPPLNLTRLLT
jgi:hypothetical protein